MFFFLSRTLSLPRNVEAEIVKTERDYIVVNIYIFFRLYSFKYINIHKNDVRDKEEINKYGKQYKF